MSAARNGNGRVDVLTSSHLAELLRVPRAHVHELRARGDLLAAVSPDTQQIVYPAWQFDDAGNVLSLVPRLVRTARERGIDGHRLCELLETRIGLTGGGRRLRDLVREGREEPALEAIARAG